MYSMRESIVQNLKDAGCKEEFIEEFMIKWDQGKNKEVYHLLELQRRFLLEELHDQQKKIDCLDYLVYQMQKSYHNIGNKGK